MKLRHLLFGFLVVGTLFSQPIPRPGLLSVPASATLVVDAAATTAGVRGDTSKPFSTLAAALTAASANDEIDVVSNLTASGNLITISKSVTLDFHGHKITSASQTDTRKIVVTADGVTIKNLEGDGTWDGSSSGSTTGSFIFVSAKNCTLQNLDIHDYQDVAIYSNVDDFSGIRIISTRLNNVKSGGVSLIANTTGSVTGVDISFLSVQNVIGGGQGLAITNNTTGTIYGVKISHFYIKGCGYHEGIYLHNVSDSSVSGGQITDSSWGVSWDTCNRSSTSDVELRGGRSDEYAPIEWAWCHYMTLANSVLDGYAIDGTPGGGTYNFGIAASTASSESTVAGPYTISNVIVMNFQAGIVMTSVYGVRIANSTLINYYSDIDLGGVGNVEITNNYLEITGSDVYDTPINISAGASSNDTAYSSVGLNKHFLISGNRLKATSTAQSEINLSSADATDTLNDLTIKNNVRVDAYSLSGGAVKQTASGGGSITGLVLRDNVPSSGWTNDDEIVDDLTASSGTKTLIGGHEAIGTITGNITLAYSGFTDTGGTRKYYGNLNFDVSHTVTLPANTYLSATANSATASMTFDAGNHSFSITRVSSTKYILLTDQFDPTPFANVAFTGLFSDLTGVPAFALSGANTDITSLTAPISINIGSVTPPTAFVVGDTASTTPRGLMSWQSSTDAASAHIHTRKSRGTFASPTTVVTNDVIGRYVFSAYDGTNFLETAYIRSLAVGTVASTRVPSKMEFYTSTDATPSVATLALTLDKDQSATFANTINATTFVGALAESLLTTTDITTNNASTSKHGFAPKGTAGTTQFWRQDWTLATPAGGGATPTGTGFTHITSGAQDSAAKLVDLTADISNAAGTALTVSPTAPTAAAASQAGATATYSASDATAGTSTNGAAAGGSVTIKGGDGKRLSSGTGAGGNVALNPGTGTGGVVADINLNGANIFAGTGSSILGLEIPNSAGYRFSSTTSNNGTVDTAIYRNAAGVAEVNNGTAGTYRDLKVRSLLPGDATKTIGGTATNDNAAATFVGEYVTASIASGSAISLTNATGANVTSISLTAGDWNVWGVVDYVTSGATTSDFKSGISTTSATFGSQDTFQNMPFIATALSDTFGHGVAPTRLSLSSTTTVYLIGQSNFSVGTATAYGSIFARRVR